VVLAGNTGSELHTRRADGAFPWPQYLVGSSRLCWIQIGGGQVLFDDTSIRSSPTDFCQYRAEVAAALQNVDRAWWLLSWSWCRPLIGQD